ncbi:DUF6048 family protein [Lutibacter sp.]|uniref:DUF6048 family protein n=1 Tax=Lutibacter sp. TaxID=1925666 RepID=UPI0025BF5A60|nr:DUF6048 family protein [Lutibacter sp.]MCF6182962.1 DUF6048 family protein [Lutibacter sp.]
MKQLHILLFIISSWFSIQSYAQQKTDTIKRQESYGIRVGVDISKPIITFFDKQNKAIEVVGDIRILNNYYLATEIGNVTKTTNEDYINFTTKGSYIKVGFNYNAYKNWIGMRNEIYVGLRYGISFFNQTLNSYTPNSNGTYFNNPQITPSNKFSGLNAQWYAFVFGMKVETLKNLYLGASVSFNKMISTKEPENFKNLYVPGFNRVFLNDSGVSFNYTLSYLIPIIKKKK